jgi:hypothetical protein
MQVLIAGSTPKLKVESEKKISTVVFLNCRYYVKKQINVCSSQRCRFKSLLNAVGSNPYRDFGSFHVRKLSR